MKIIATGLPKTVEDYQVALNAAFAGGVAYGKGSSSLKQQVLVDALTNIAEMCSAPPNYSDFTIQEIALLAVENFNKE